MCDPAFKSTYQRRLHTSFQVWLLRRWIVKAFLSAQVPIVTPIVSSVQRPSDVLSLRLRQEGLSTNPVTSCIAEDFRCTTSIAL